jgi:hypothetical protein
MKSYAIFLISGCGALVITDSISFLELLFVFYKGSDSFVNWSCVVGIFFSLHETALFVLSPPIGNKLLPWKNVRVV